MARLVVLLGPPGSGKSTVGEELRRLRLRWRDWEADLVQHGGGREAFIAHKEEALRRLHTDLLAFIVEDAHLPAVIESTGLSDASFLDGLARDHDVLTVRLDVPEPEAMRRIASRAQGRHLSDDQARNRLVWRAFQTTVAPVRAVDLVINTESVDAEAAAVRIRNALAAPEWVGYRRTRMSGPSTKSA